MARTHLPPRPGGTDASSSPPWCHISAALRWPPPSEHPLCPQSVTLSNFYSARRPLAGWSCCSSRGPAPPAGPTPEPRRPGLTPFHAMLCTEPTTNNPHPAAQPPRSFPRGPPSLSQIRGQAFTVRHKQSRHVPRLIQLQQHTEDNPTRVPVQSIYPAYGALQRGLLKSNFPTTAPDTERKGGSAAHFPESPLCLFSNTYTLAA